MDSITQNTKITSTQINTLINEINGKLNLSGGTLTGTLNLNHHQLLNPNSIEFSPSSSSGHGGYIDFHYNGSSADFTSRIIESSSGCITIVTSNGLYLNGDKIKTESTSFNLYDRSEVGTSVNLDNPGFNGFFEVRSNNEVTYTGSKPYDSFYPMITINHTNCAFQLGGSKHVGFYIRGKQMANPTLENVEWSRIATFNTSNRLEYPNGTQMWIS